MACRFISGMREHSAEEIQVRAARVAMGWKNIGLTEGDSVALLLRNSETFIEAATAAAKLGVYAVPVNWHSAPKEVRYILEDSGARVLVAHVDLFSRIAEEVPPGIQVLLVPTPPEIAEAYQISATDASVPSGQTSWEDWIMGHEALTDPPPAHRNNMIYTSGTTGHPKGVRRDPLAPSGAAPRERLLREVFGIESGMRTVITGPVYHSAPNAYALTAAAVGDLVVFQARFDAEQLLALIEEHRITHLHMVPIMFVRLLRLPSEVRARYDISSLRWVIHGAAPCAPEVKEAMIAWWGPVIYEYYGSTETSLNTTISSAEWLERPGSVGRANHGSTVSILDEAGRELPPGEVGRIFVTQQSLPGFTYHGNHAKRQGMEHNGRLTVGDVGFLDKEGYLTLCDREIDMVISGGVNVYPAEIEGVLINAPGVHDCAVFGIPDEEYGEALFAIVQPEPGVHLSSDDLRAYLKTRVAAYKVPRRIEFKEALPREDSGKIFKRKLRAPHWEGKTRRI